MPARKRVPLHAGAIEHRKIEVPNRRACNLARALDGTRRAGWQPRQRSITQERREQYGGPESIERVLAMSGDREDRESCGYDGITQQVRELEIFNERSRGPQFEARKPLGAKQRVIEAEQALFDAYIRCAHE